MLGLTDETGVKVADVKVDLISTLPTDLLEKVDDAVASMAGTTFAAVSGQVDSGASAAQAGYNDAQMIGDCIPALARTLQTAATIVRTVSKLTVQRRFVPDRLNAFIVDQFEHVYVLIDALDECTNTETLTMLKWIEEVVRILGSGLRLLVTSRQEGDIEKSLGQLCTQGHTKLANRREEIKASVMKNAQGMFGLAALQIEDLSKCHNWAQMKKSLDRPLKTSFEMYYQILNRLDSGEREDALHIL
ncbi:hypothetical protein HETIRDRAFT_455913 [Heterobasidion irregulare TC 32-1]|uniref:Nephrocystin 3-like N-terminal domain-containing protein n=1 Tax=Heterobasidion irregulare (strain TC 32-1) TaxID=747525 RepID=W4JNX9_HETIT|nr:uncharacterized protein HETIRDRAFT_455913 [Heterobasidion irregulare TC 32-1]ETW75262.1 hypothetical protein HETIRDRAFT_455913 [Heterobasidion irregulare TC 32-1]